MQSDIQHDNFFFRSSFGAGVDRCNSTSKARAKPTSFHWVPSFARAFQTAVHASSHGRRTRARLWSVCSTDRHPGGGFHRNDGQRHGSRRVVERGMPMFIRAPHDGQMNASAFYSLCISAERRTMRAAACPARRQRRRHRSSSGACSPLASVRGTPLSLLLAVRCLFSLSAFAPFSCFLARLMC